MCPKHAHKDTPDSSVSSTPGPYRADCVSRPLFHYRIAQTNSTLLIVSRIQPSDSFKYFHAFSSFFEDHSLAKLRSFPLNLIKKFLVAIKVLPITMPDMLPTKTHHKSLTANTMANYKFFYQYELTHASTSPTTLPQK
jgi:hypothetical protein